MQRLLLPVVLLLSGCANFNTISRSTDLPGGGKAIHLDSAQRLVYTNKFGALCAEPTPDALQSYAAGMGMGVGVTDKGSAALSNAFSANSASVGLHTQSITLMRDTLYRICEYSNSGNAAPMDVVQLLQRSQNLTLGVLAIEQLTGAVVARQAALSAGASSTSAATINDTEAQLEIAKKNEAAKKNELALAQEAEKKQKVALSTAQAALKVETDKPVADQDKVKVAAMTATAKAEQLLLNEKSTATTDASAALARAVASAEAIGKMFSSAITAASAATTGNAQLVGSDGHRNVDKDTALALSAATVDIVKNIVDKTYITDTCMNFLTRNANNPDKSNEAVNTLLTQCTAVLKVTMDNYVRRAGGTPADGEGPQPVYTGSAVRPMNHTDDRFKELFEAAMKANEKEKVESQNKKK